MDLHEKHAESEQTLKKDTQEDPVSWSDLDKATAYAILAIFCIGVIIGLTLILLLYRDRFGI